MKEDIKRFPLFNQIDEKTFVFLMENSGVKVFKKGSFCFRLREPVSCVYIMIEGRAIIYNLTHNGQRKIIYILGRGKLLNESIVTKQPPSVFCELIEDSKVLVIPMRVVHQAMRQDFQFTQSIMCAQEKKIWRLYHQLKNTAGSVQMERKLAAKLWKLARDFGQKTSEGILIEFPMSVTFLADLLGTPRETASRLCKSLTEYGLIRMQKNKQILILNPEELSKFYKNGHLTCKNNTKKL